MHVFLAIFAQNTSLGGEIADLKAQVVRHLSRCLSKVIVLHNELNLNVRRNDSSDNVALLEYTLP